MIVALIEQANTAAEILYSASEFATLLGKPFGVLCFDTTQIEISPDILPENTQIFVRKEGINILSSICDEIDASFLFVQLTKTGQKQIKKKLAACRNLRIPYMFFKDSFVNLQSKKVLVPVGFLEEEIEKTQFASAFGRFCDATIILLLAHDYGTKASTNAKKMQTIFDTFGLLHQTLQATKDSFGVDYESISVAEKEEVGIIIISASREYGLDDILFGPKEYHIVKYATIPILLVNPRSDLYTLCD